MQDIVILMTVVFIMSKLPIKRCFFNITASNEEMELILKYCPFKTEAQFMKTFDKIKGGSGTLVIIYNLKLLDSGHFELDVKTDPQDIILANPNLEELDSDEG